MEEDVSSVLYRHPSSWGDRELVRRQLHPFRWELVVAKKRTHSRSLKVGSVVWDLTSPPHTELHLGGSLYALQTRLDYI